MKHLQVRGRGGVARNSLAGAIATACDFALFTALVRCVGFSPPVATALGCTLGGIINFAINRWWAFSSHGALPTMALRYAFVSVASAMLNSVGVALLLLVPGLGSELGWIIARGAVYFGFNYPLHKRFVFRHSAED